MKINILCGLAVIAVIALFVGLLFLAVLQTECIACGEYSAYEYIKEGRIHNGCLMERINQ